MENFLKGTMNVLGVIGNIVWIASVVWPVYGALVSGIQQIITHYYTTKNASINNSNSNSTEVK